MYHTFIALLIMKFTNSAPFKRKLRSQFWSKKMPNASRFPHVTRNWLISSIILSSNFLYSVYQSITSISSHFDLDLILISFIITRNLLLLLRFALIEGWRCVVTDHLREVWMAVANAAAFPKNQSREFYSKDFGNQFPTGEQNLLSLGEGSEWLYLNLDVSHF